MINWLHNFIPQAVLLDLGLFKIYWYGLFVVLAILACLLLLSFLTKGQWEIRRHFEDLFIYLIIFGLLGARLYHVLFYNLDYFIANPLEIVMFWHGGLAIYGAIIAGLIVVYLYAKKHQLSWWRYADLLALVLPLGQAIGRWGNYFNQELYGRPCEFDWCIPIQNQADFFHPMFLYESILNLFLLAILLVLYKIKKLSAGAIVFSYLAGYSAIRFFMEFLRLDVSQIFGGLKWVQWLCLIIIAISLVGIFKALPRKNN